MRPLLLSTLVPLLLLAQPALGDDAAIAQAKQRFSAGKAAYAEGRYKDAVQLFAQANALDPHAELLYNVGQAYEKLDDVSNALRVFREYLRLLPNAADRATVEQKCVKFQERLQAHGVQQVTISSSPTGAVLLVDDRAVGPTPWTGEIAPGHHVAVLKFKGYADGTREFDLAPSLAMDVDVSLSRPGPAVPVAPVGPTAGGPTGAPPPPTPPPDTPARERHVAPWTFAALGVGVAGLGAAIGLEVARKGAETTARNEPIQVTYMSDLNQMTTFQTASRAMVGVGAAALVAGGVLLFLDLRPQGSDGKAPTTALGCFSGACGAFASGRF